MLREFVVLINDSATSIALRESLLLWPLIEATHVLSIILFVGTIIVVDLRILGAVLKDAPIPAITTRVLPWALLGFALLALTGLALFYAKPLTYYHNVFFRLKILIIMLALINVGVFHWRAGSGWEGTAPAIAKATATASLLAWVSVIIAGRLVAYDWFDCPKLMPESALRALAGCPLTFAMATDG